MSVIDGIKSLGQTVAKYAPLLGDVIPLPGAKAITAIIADAFGGDPDDPKDLINRINANPEAQIKLIEIQSNTNVQLQQILANLSLAEMQNNRDILAYELQDVANARDMNIKSNKRVDDIIKLFLVTVIGSILLGSLWAIVTGTVTTEEANLVSYLVGSAWTAFIAIVGFYWGTSSSSRGKDAAISALSFKK